MITDRPNEQDSVIQHDGAPVVIVRWPRGNRSAGESWAREVSLAVARVLAADEDTVAARDAAIARLTRERDEAREDFESASYDTARLITAIRTLTHTEAWALSEDVEANGRAGWVAEARKLGGKVEGMRGSLERERDEARAEVERLRANLASIVTHVREPQDAEIARLRERETLLMLAMAWGRELAEHAGCVDCWAFDAHEELIEESLDLAETLGVDTGSDYDLIATARRLRERVDFYELGHYRAKALRDALSSEEAQAVRGVLLAAVAWNELATQGPIGKRLSAALEAWTAAGRPLLAAVPAPASEGER
jgi:hypothetical protein